MRYKNHLFSGTKISKLFALTPSDDLSKRSNNKPWIRMNDAYTDINVADQENDPDSVLNYYRKLIFLRKQHPVLVSVDAENISEQL